MPPLLPFLALSRWHPSCHTAFRRGGHVRRGEPESAIPSPITMTMVVKGDPNHTRDRGPSPRARSESVFLPARRRRCRFQRGHLLSSAAAIATALISPASLVRVFVCASLDASTALPPALFRLPVIDRATGHFLRQPPCHNRHMSYDSYHEQERGSKIRCSKIEMHLCCKVKHWEPGPPVMACRDWTFDQWVCPLQEKRTLQISFTMNSRAGHTLIGL